MPAPPRSAPPVELTWWGHACVSLEAPGLPTVLVDPFLPGALGGRLRLPAPAMTPDLVAVTHWHEDHAGIAPHWRAPVVDGPSEVAEAMGVRIEALPVEHDACRGVRMGLVRALCIHYGGVRLVHLGDASEVPLPAAFDAWAGCDVLVVPCGGTYTYGPHGALAAIERLSPRAALAVHAADPAIDLPLLPASRTARRWTGPVRALRRGEPISLASLPAGGPALFAPAGGDRAAP